MGNQFLTCYSLVLDVMLFHPWWSFPTHLARVVPDLTRAASQLPLLHGVQSDLGAKELSLCCGEQTLIQ